VETGTMDFVMTCRSREFDPNYAASPFYPHVKPTRAVRLRAQTTTDAVVYQRFFGYTLGWPQRRSQAGKDLVAVFTAADPLFALALDKVQGSTPRPAETAGARLDALLGGIPNIKVSLEAGQSELVASDLDGVNRLEHAQAVVESDGGIFYAAGDGTVTFEDRHHRTIFEQTVRASYGDGGGAELPLEHQEPEIDEGHIYTAARVTDAFGRIAEARDDDAAREHFVRTKEVASLHTNPNDAQAMAEAYAHRYSTPRERIREIRINPAAKASAPLTMWETVLGHEISHRIKNVERVGGDGSSVPRELFIEGVTDQILPFDWRVILSTSPAELEGNYWILGTGKLAGFPRTPILDTFNRANENPMTGWTDFPSGSGLEVISNQAASGSTGVQDGAYFNTSINSADVEVYVTIAALPTNLGSTVLYARNDPAGGGIVGDNYAIRHTVDAGTDYIFISRHDNSVSSPLASYRQDLAAGDGLGMRCVGSTIQAWVRISGIWTMIGEVEDGTYPGGGTYNKVAVAHFETGAPSVRWDDFGGGAYAPDPTTSTALGW